MYLLARGDQDSANRTADLADDWRGFESVKRNRARKTQHSRPVGRLKINYLKVLQLLRGNREEVRLVGGGTLFCSFALRILMGTTRQCACHDSERKQLQNRLKQFRLHHGRLLVPTVCRNCSTESM